jgi:hypothetical protein
MQTIDEPHTGEFTAAKIYFFPAVIHDFLDRHRV